MWLHIFFPDCKWICNSIHLVSLISPRSNLICRCWSALHYVPKIDLIYYQCLRGTIDGYSIFSKWYEKEFRSKTMKLFLLIKLALTSSSSSYPCRASRRAECQCKFTIHPSRCSTSASQSSEVKFMKIRSTFHRFKPTSDFSISDRSK